MPKSLLASAFLLGLLATDALAAKPRKPRQGELAPSVTVVGSGEVTAKPDMAQITLGVVTEAPSAGEALQANNAAMERLLETLKQRGIEEQDIQTTNFSVSPQYRHDPPRPRGVPGPQEESRPRIVGYQVSNQVAVKVRKLSSLGAVLDEVVSAGANQIHGISFSLNDPENRLDEARRLAMADARRKAELYAKAAGAGMGRALLIQEATPNVPQPVYAGVRMMAAESAVPIATGEQTLTATVTVTYVLENAEKEE